MGALTKDEEWLVKSSEREPNGPDDQELCRIVRRLAGRVEELERGLRMLGRAIYDGAPDTLWLLEEDAINMTAVECIDGLLSRAPTAPREAATEKAAAILQWIDSGELTADLSDRAPTESTGADVDRNGEPRIYPCDECGTLRSKAEGGTVFTVCDDCWDRHFRGTTPTSEESK
jgi:hypothetical protein